MTRCRVFSTRLSVPVFASLFLAAACARSPKDGAPTADANHVVSGSAPAGPSSRIVGRQDLSDPNGPIFIWSNSQIQVGFVGTQLTLHLKEMDDRQYNGATVHNEYAVAVDGKPTGRVVLGAGLADYIVASKLSQGQHQLTFTRLTEAQFGRTQWLGAATDGQLTSTPKAPERRIEFVGDSGTCGYGADGQAPCSFTTSTENAAAAYPAVVGSLLNAEIHNICYSGKGLFANRDMVNDSIKTLPVLWSWTLADDPNQRPFDPNQWVPQAVVIITGGNDFYNGIPAEQDFVAAVSKYLQKVRLAYPSAHIFLGLSSMLQISGNNDRQFATSACQAVVAQLADSKIHFIDIPADDGTRGYGCDDHPNVASHAVIGKSIAATLATTLGW